MERFSLYDPKWLQGEYRPQIDAYYYRQWVDFHMGFHAHPQIEIMYAISGSCIVETYDQLLSLGSGDFILLDSCVPHRLVVDRTEPCRMLNVEFSFAPCSGIYPSFSQLASSTPALSAMLGQSKEWVVLSDPSDVQHTLKSLVLELDGGAEERTSMAHLLISQLLIHIARLAVDVQRSGADRQTDRYVRAAIQYIHQNYDRDIQAKDIAAHVNLHPVYLQRIFRPSMQQTMAEYLAVVRIEKAKMLLGRTDIPIAEIADYVGLNSRQYFSALFKRLTGVTPAAYRHSVELDSRISKVAIVDIDDGNMLHL
ncbi:AraC-like DNA-binding protein [Paenibacillus phyllosphaerae]|uniref:AraC-like DNA-binding protein n=1 Tax=Paenibacillus phyllosphaerae TaxID=274593 RepID=A0A7W5B5W1_9BACL|nr:AraC family transcriptional regulator [Paenibacillus phyllosphaerae]MBB3114526.1 AraC-like DNA-binding protein [Paenibacillus phyllosphaerae]